LGGDLLVATGLAEKGQQEALREALYDEYTLAVDAADQIRHERFSMTAIADQRAAIAKLRDKANALLGTRRPFHWPLEFPEVFIEGSVCDDHGGFDAIVGNPPFIGGQRITGALGTDYRGYLVEHLGGGRRGSADLSAYFFLQARQLLRSHGGFGLLATNTIAQGDTREVGLDRLVADGCTITRAVPSRRWPGTASLEVAHLWVRRSTWNGQYILDDAPVAGITPFLMPPGAVQGTPYRLAANAGQSFQGSNVLGMGFVLAPEEAQTLIDTDPRNRDVLFPYLNGEDLNSRADQSPSRWVINFHDWPLERAETYPDCMRIVREKVKPGRDRLASGDSTAKDRARRWWQFARPTMNLYATITGMERVLVLCLVTQNIGFAFVPANQVFSHKLVVFPVDDWGRFALLQSNLHEPWARGYSSTLATALNYSPSDCFGTFPFPQTNAGLDTIGKRYYTRRQSIMLAYKEGLTKTYNRFHDRKEMAADIACLRELHVEMDCAAAAAYGWDDLDLGHGFHPTKQGMRFTISEAARREVLGRLLALNHECYAEEVRFGLHDKAAKRTAKGKKRAGDTPEPAGIELFGEDVA
jgi:hypothetical protein